MTDTLPLLLPTAPGKVHGIVSLDPPTVQCDGFHFNPRRLHDKRRLCRDCAKAAGWQR